MMKYICLLLVCFALLLTFCTCAPQSTLETDRPSVSRVPSNELLTPAPTVTSSASALLEEEVFVEGYVVSLADVSVSYKLSEFYRNGIKKEAVHVQLGDDIVRFMGYEHYLDRGLSFRYKQVTTDGTFDGTYSGGVSNILISKNYTGEIIQGHGITMQSSIDAVMEILGPPPYRDEARKLRGYKLRDCYLFFVGEGGIDEISVYPRRSKVMEEDAFSLTSFVETMEADLGGLHSKEDIFIYLMEHLDDYTYSYQGQDRYIDRSGYMIRFIEWGIDFTGNTEDWHLTLYGNCGITEELLDKQSEHIKILPTVDLLFESEKQRITKKMDFPERVAAEGVVSPNGKLAVLSNDDGQLDRLYTGVYVVSLDGNVPDRELYGGWYELHWLSNRYFVAFAHRSADIYDVELKRVIFSENWDNTQTLEFQDGKFIKKNYEDDVLVRISHSFDENGDIRIERH